MRIEKAFAITGAAICGTAAATAYYLTTDFEMYARSLVLCIPFGIGAGGFYNAIPAIWDQSDDITERVGVGAIVGAAFGLTGTGGWVAFLAGVVGYAAGAGVGVAVRAAMRVSRGA